jgi:hypothetical protein
MIRHPSGTANAGECFLRYCQDNRKKSHGHEGVAIKKEETPQAGHATNLHTMPSGGKAEPRQRVR